MSKFLLHKNDSITESKASAIDLQQLREVDCHLVDLHTIHDRVRSCSNNFQHARMHARDGPQQSQ